MPSRAFPRAGAAASDTGVGVVRIGTTGSNTLKGTSLDDLLSGGSGHDVLSGGSGKDILDGGSGNDRISGGRGADLVMGGKGNDRLSGGGGADVFVFGTGLRGSRNVDRISDFSARSDTIRLDDTVFRKPGPADKFLKSSAFWTGKAAHDASDRIVHDRDAGALLYDPVGAGSLAPVQFAQLRAGLKLTHKDFLIV